MIVCIAPNLSTHHRATVQGEHGEWMHVQTGDAFTDSPDATNCPTCKRYLTEGA